MAEAGNSYSWRAVAMVLSRRHGANATIAKACEVACDAQFRCVELTTARRAELQELGISLGEGADDPSNIAFVSSRADAAKSRLDLAGRKDCCFVLDGPGHTEISVEFEADRTALCKLGGGWVKLGCRLRDPGAALVLEGACDIGGLDAWVEGENVGLSIGSGSLLAWNIMMRTGDSHAIISRCEARKISRQASICIGERVWIGEGAVIGKGVTIGRGSIVGARAVVTRDVEPFVAVAGNPARIIRRDVAWTRSRSPSEQEIRSAAQWEG